ncbi:MAG: hypothetical protein IPK68_19695 [Bdellovibrionales bacterium]|nr:hypothetical protein [Bdellovibrionales bacterium]
MQFYFSFERSPSLRFLVETLENNGSHTAEALHQKYSFDDVIRRRIEQMAEVKLLLATQENGQKKYFNSPKGRRVGQFCGFMKKFMQLGDGG